MRRVQYADDKEFEKCVNKILNELLSEKISLKEVTFLSPKSYKNSILSRAKISVNDLANNYDAASSLPRFSTIQKSKGLDS